MFTPLEPIGPAAGDERAMYLLAPERARHPAEVRVVFARDILAARIARGGSLVSGNSWVVERARAPASQTNPSRQRSHSRLRQRKSVSGSFLPHQAVA